MSKYISQGLYDDALGRCILQAEIIRELESKIADLEHKIMLFETLAEPCTL